MEPLKSRFISQETVSFLWKLAVAWVLYNFQAGKEETLFDIIGNIHIIRFLADSWMRTIINITYKAITRRWDIYLGKKTENMWKQLIYCTSIQSAYLHFSLLTDTLWCGCLVCKKLVDLHGGHLAHYVLLGCSYFLVISFLVAWPCGDNTDKMTVPG